MALPTQVQVIGDQAMSLSCSEQFALAERIAANVGYQLVPEMSIQQAENKANILHRIDRMESAIQELNPGWRP